MNEKNTSKVAITYLTACACMHRFDKVQTIWNIQEYLRLGRELRRKIMHELSPEIIKKVRLSETSLGSSKHTMNMSYHYMNRYCKQYLSRTSLGGAKKRS